ncbi:hypothetical protein BY996DRAFT_6435047 [Phakopsora pachyrhizi]|uniref:Uncharacterized protein n=1 Tax=Phakopsora pachyrhizi TaxID=170000 RepID=A0AAV0AU15_PHAPC|nr:hypothetical protein BY996DRAFT_6435047 [Phakopsora pachyrhizi]CAH7672919.1 hypothetical protein PPACK8108_LOCUS7755 [Phakopsora pachyrhizi]
MEILFFRGLSTIFSLINKTIRNVLDFNSRHSGFSLQLEHTKAYALKWLLAVIVAWQNSVPLVEIDTAVDVVIPILDTHKLLMLCGPPGSGKKMTLYSALRKLTDLNVVGAQFSRATTPEMIIYTFEHHCENKRTSTWTVLARVQIGKWTVIFCDENNFPSADKYGFQ